MHATAYKFIYQHIFMQYVHCKVRASVLESGQIFTAQIQTGESAYQKILWQAVVVHGEKSYPGPVLHNIRRVASVIFRNRFHFLSRGTFSISAAAWRLGSSFFFLPHTPTIFLKKMWRFYSHGGVHVWWCVKFTFSRDAYILKAIRTFSQGHRNIKEEI